MTVFKEFNTLHLSIVGVSLLALASGCSSNRGGTYSTTPTYYSATGTTEAQPGAVTSTTSSDMSMAQKRTDITDTGPGTPRGDATSANPSEASSQGAGSRALVGEAGARQSASTAQGSATVAQGGTSSTLEGEGAAQGSASAQGATSQASTNLVIPLHKEQLQVGKREVDAGTVTVRKSVRTETVNEPVQLRTETVTIDRQPAQGGTAQAQSSAAAGQQQQLGQPFQQQEFTIHLKREEPVVQKQVVPAGEIVAQTHVQNQQTNVQGQVRREEVVVDKGNAQGVTLSSNLRNAPQSRDTAMGGGGEVGGQSGGAASSSASSSGGAITDLNTLMSGTENPSSLAGRSVRLSGVRVQTVVDPHLFVIGGQGGQPIYVRVQQPVQGLKDGATVDLNGMVQQPAQAATASRDLSGEATHVLMQQPIYVDAQSVQVTNNNQSQ